MQATALARGVRVASSGSHALAVLQAAAEAAHRAAGAGQDGGRVRVTIHLPQGTDPAAADRLTALGADVVHSAAAGIEGAEAEARAAAAEEGSTFVSAYNDVAVAGAQVREAACLSWCTPAGHAGAQVCLVGLPCCSAACCVALPLRRSRAIGADCTRDPLRPGHTGARAAGAGTWAQNPACPARGCCHASQGTVALELLMQAARGRLDAVFVPVGGGGLTAGVSAVLKAVAPHVHVIGGPPWRPQRRCLLYVAPRLVRVHAYGRRVPCSAPATSAPCEHASTLTEPPA